MQDVGPPGQLGQILRRYHNVEDIFYASLRKADAVVQLEWSWLVQHRLFRGRNERPMPTILEDVFVTHDNTVIAVFSTACLSLRMMCLIYSLHSVYSSPVSAFNCRKALQRWRAHNSVSWYPSFTTIGSTCSAIASFFDSPVRFHSADHISVNSLFREWKGAIASTQPSSCHGCYVWCTLWLSDPKSAGRSLKPPPINTGWALTATCLPCCWRGHQ